MTESIPEDYQRRIERLMKSGNFPNEAAVIAEALTLLEQRQELHALIQEGIDSADRGELIDLDTAMQQIRQHINQLAVKPSQQSVTGG